MKPVLVGSHALKYYNLLHKRVPDDWDFLIEFEKKFVKKNGYSFDFINANDPIEKTNRTIFELSQSGPLVDSPIGLVHVIPLSLLKVMKLSSIPINKIKNIHDLEYLNHVSLSSEEERILEKRIIETKNKVMYKKSVFFDKYEIPRFFQHEDLHYFVSKNPMFLKIQKEIGTEVCSDLFNQLSLENKKRLIWEEAFVLSLERFLVPKIRKFPNFIDILNNNFYNVKKSSDVGVYWLNKLCEKDKLKDNPLFIQEWGELNYSLLLDGYESWWEETFDNLDESFWIKLLSF